MAGNDNDCRWPRKGLQPAQCFEAVDPRQPNVEEDGLKLAIDGVLESFLARSHGIDAIALALQNRGERLADPGFIVHNQNAGMLRHRRVSEAQLRPARCVRTLSAAGNSTKKRGPTGRLSPTLNLAPWSATRRAAMAHPRPVPATLVEQPRRKTFAHVSGQDPL